MDSVPDKLNEAPAQAKPTRKKNVSERQREANRANAQKSTGPRSDAGKEAVRLNSLLHGITAATLCLPCEDLEDLRLMRAEYHRAFQPRNFVEHNLVDAIFAAAWRESRAARYENSLIREAFADRRARNEQRYERLSLDVETALAFKTLSDDSNCLENLDRYERRLRRQSIAAMRQLAEYRRSFPPAVDSTTYTPVYVEMEKLQSKPIPTSEHPPIGNATEENTVQLRLQTAEPATEESLTTSVELTTDNRQLTTRQPLTTPAELTTDHWPLTTELTTDNCQLTTPSDPLTTDHKPLTTSVELTPDNGQLTTAQPLTTSAELTTDHGLLTTELTTHNRQLTTPDSEPATQDWQLATDNWQLVRAA